MAPPVTQLTDLAVATLNAIVAGWPGDAEPLPDVQFVSNGEIAMDSCEALAVFVDRTFPIEADVTFELSTGITGINVGNRGATVGVSLMRCVPISDDQGNPPSPEAQSESADLILRDAQALFNVLLAANRDLASCNGFAFESWVPIGPTGGQGGGTLRFRVSLVA